MIYTAGILDCEIKDSYWLNVYATDKGVTPLSASIEVFIQVHARTHSAANAPIVPRMHNGRQTGKMSFDLTEIRRERIV